MHQTHSDGRISSGTRLNVNSKAALFSSTQASAPLPPLPRLLRASRPLASRLEHRPLDRGDPLLEAARACPREARRGCESAAQRCLRQTLLRVVEESCAEAACEQFSALLAYVALTRDWCEAGTLRRLAHRLQRERRHRKDGAN